jgi:hypothetical protein
VWALAVKTKFAERILIEAAKGWVLSAARDKKAKEPLAFYDEHGLDLQRAYNVVCFMVGADPEKFKPLATVAKLPEERLGPCKREYKTTAWSWEEVLKPHRRTPDKPKVAIKIDYQESKDYAAQVAVLRQMRMLEIFAEQAAEQIAWPKPFTIEARECGEANARWFLQSRTLTLCYELAGEFIELFKGYSGKLPAAPKVAKSKPVETTR